MSFAKQVRLFFRELFGSKYVVHLEEEVAHLREQLEQARLDNAKLQLFLNEVNPAGLMKRRLDNPPPKPAQQPGVKRWAQVEAERYAEIADLRRKEAEAAKKDDLQSN